MSHGIYDQISKWTVESFMDSFQEQVSVIVLLKLFALLPGT